MKSVFDVNDKNEILNRIDKLSAESTPEWGQMNASKMLAHCNVTYEMVYENIYPKPNLFKAFLLKLFVKNIVVSDKPYSKNGRTAPNFIIRGDREFEKEKQKLINYINKTQELGSSHFEGKKSISFGNLTSKEWNNMFYKHLDHHLSQFGV